MKLLLIIALLPAFAWAGRPVFSEIDLEQLVAASDLIVVAEPGETKRKELEPGCSVPAKTFKVREVLKGLGPKVGESIEVLPPNFWIQVEVCHRGIGPSYPALRYVSQDQSLKKPKQARMVFVKRRPKGELFFAATGAEEGLSKRSLVASREMAKPSAEPAMMDGTVVMGCSPWDGRASIYTITLDRADPPLVVDARFWQNSRTLPHVLKANPSNTEGALRVCQGAGNSHCETPSSGEFIVEKLGDTHEGRADLKLPSGKHLRFRFRARSQESRAVCG